MAGGASPSPARVMGSLPCPGLLELSGGYCSYAKAQGLVTVVRNKSTSSAMWSQLTDQEGMGVGSRLFTFSIPKTVPHPPLRHSCDCLRGAVLGERLHSF